MSIPKIIHYCWFGGKQQPAYVIKNIKEWQKIIPDYKFIEWNENNFPMDSIPIYAKEAMREGKIAFLTDYVRLYVLYQYGGIYLDVDVEIIRPFTDKMLQHDFIGLEDKMAVCSAVIGAEPKSRWIGDLLNLYEKRRFIINGTMDLTPNSEYIFNFLMEQYDLKYIESNDIDILKNGLTIYGNIYFSPMDFVTGKIKITHETYTVHHFKSTWKSPKSRLIGRASLFLHRVVGDKIHRKIKYLFMQFSR